MKNPVAIGTNVTSKYFKEAYYERIDNLNYVTIIGYVPTNSRIYALCEGFVHGLMTSRSYNYVDENLKTIPNFEFDEERNKMYIDIKDLEVYRNIQFISNNRIKIF